jgi:tetratricopeptide (TPR) repeat protein
MRASAEGIEDGVTGDGEKPVAPERVQITIEQAIEIVMSLMKRDASATPTRYATRCWSSSPTIQTRFTMPACWRTNATATMRRWISFGAASSSYRNSQDWYSNLGIVLQSVGRFEAAMEAFRRAIALNPAHQNALNNLGVLQRLHGQIEEAEASYRAVIALNPNHPDVYLNLAVVLDQTGRVQEALTAYCKAITLRPSHPQAHRHLAIAYAEIGETQKAIEVCEEWVRNNPNDPRAVMPSPPTRAVMCLPVPAMPSWRTCSTTSPRASKPSWRGWSTRHRRWWPAPSPP